MHVIIKFEPFWKRVSLAPWKPQAMYKHAYSQPPTSAPVSHYLLYVPYAYLQEIIQWFKSGITCNENFAASIGTMLKGMG